MKKIYFVFAALLVVACTDNVVTVIPEPVSMTVGSGSILLSLEDGIEPEGYELEVSGSKVAVKGGSSALWTSTTEVISHPRDNRRFDHEGERTVPNLIAVY